MSITGKNYDVRRDEELVNMAIFYFSKALEFCDTFISSKFHLGLMYRRTNRLNDALLQFSKVQEQVVNDKTVYIQRGLVY